MWFYYRQNLFFNSTPEGNTENFLVNFCEIFKNTHFAEYLQQVLLPIAASAVESVLTFIIPIWQLCKMKNKWINNKLLLNFLQLLRQLDVMDLTAFLVALCAYSPLLAPSLFFGFLVWGMSCLGHAFRGVSWFCGVYACMVIGGGIRIFVI